MVSVHGLIRGKEPELGRDPDTGGQVGYVLDLVHALAKNKHVEKVDLLTRKVESPAISADYAADEEILTSNSRIVRLRCGPRRYIRKEALWPYLDEFVDRTLQHFKAQERLPDILHTHYADAGYVGLQLSSMLNIPLIHTGHSLGRVKRQYLLEGGMTAAQIERRFRISRRIEVEEQILDQADMVITSTRQEADQQYGLYERTRPNRIRVIPPGMDLSRFHPPERDWHPPEAVRNEVDRFLTKPNKPMILTIARADRRKNLEGLVEAYGKHPELQRRANLVVVAGNRDEIATLEDSAAQIVTNMLLLIDKYELNGKVSMPKHHQPDDVPELFRLAQKRRGVFVNSAITEAFGLTLLEAAASGVPLVAPNDGGPVDIIRHCRNGFLVDTLDHDALADALLAVITAGPKWRQWARNGIAGVRNHYAWDSHVEKYIKEARQVIRSSRKSTRRRIELLHKPPLIHANRILALDIDNVLVGDAKGLKQLLGWIELHQKKTIFAVATGRSLHDTQNVLRQHNVPLPEVIISSVGSEIHYGPKILPDLGWATHIQYSWRREATVQTLKQVPGLTLQPIANQREFKISYNVSPESMPSIEEISNVLNSHGLRANLIYSHSEFLDVLPIRASKGRAIRYLSYKWGVPLEKILVAGDSGNDEEMLEGRTLGVVVGNYSPELERLRGHHQIYFAKAEYALGVLEGIEHYRFCDPKNCTDAEQQLQS
ncbi:MAG: HAD-IIB family hydrolase [Actinomycetota bacterium]|nr:MAG: HAD-IIB family hydrolase [Actinomycetota bacterium]